MAIPDEPYRYDRSRFHEGLFLVRERGGEVIAHTYSEDLAHAITALPKLIDALYLVTADGANQDDFVQIAYDALAGLERQ